MSHALLMSVYDAKEEGGGEKKVFNAICNSEEVKRIRSTSPRPGQQKANATHIDQMTKLSTMHAV